MFAHIFLVSLTRNSGVIYNNSGDTEHPYFTFKFIYFNWRLITLQYCIGFAINQHESAMGVQCGDSLKNWK